MLLQFWPSQNRECQGKSKITKTLLPNQTSHPYSSTSCLLLTRVWNYQITSSYELVFSKGWLVPPGTYFCSFHTFHVLMPQLLLSIPLNTLLHSVCGSFPNSCITTYIMTDFCTSFSRSCASLNCYMHMIIEEQCRLFTLLCMLSHNEFNYLTNLLFFIKKRSTDSAQKHMPHTVTFTSILCDTFWLGYVIESEKKGRLKNHSLFTCDLEDQISP